MALEALGDLRVRVPFFPPEDEFSVHGLLAAYIP